MTSVVGCQIIRNSMDFLAPFYEYIYTIVCFIAMKNALKSPSSLLPPFTSINTHRQSAMITGICICLFLGLRPVARNFGDTLGYSELYNVIYGQIFTFDPSAENLLFDNLLFFCASIRLSEHSFYLLMSIIYFSCIGIACRKIFADNSHIGFMVYLLGFSTYSYAINGFKAGAAAAIFLVALAYKDKLWLTIPLALISNGFHHSMTVVVYAYIISYFVKKTKWYFYGWLFCLFIAATHIGFFQSLFASYADESGASYLLAEGDVLYITGFRLDFILYSAAPVVIGYYILFKYRLRDSMYELWLRMYLLTNGVWLLCMYASFTNRIAYLSWFMLPIVTIYPFYAMKGVPNRLQVGNKVAMYHAYFTLFMVFVYYGFMSII